MNLLTQIRTALVEAEPNPVMLTTRDKTGREAQVRAPGAVPPVPNHDQDFDPLSDDFETC